MAKETISELQAGNLNLTGNTLKSTNTNGDINVTPDGTGDAVIDGIKHPQADGSANQFLQTDGAGQLSFVDVLNVGTEQATTSGTEFDFTSLPAGITRMTMIFNEISLSGTDDLLVQLGDSGGLESTGYVSSSMTITTTPTSATNTTGFVVRGALASGVISGRMIFIRISGNIWIADHNGKMNTTNTINGGGSKTLSGELTQIRLTRSGTDTFDAGSVNIVYEL